MINNLNIFIRSYHTTNVVMNDFYCKMNLFLYRCWLIVSNFAAEINIVDMRLLQSVKM